MRVYRLQTDTGERILGRKVLPAWVASALEAGTSNLSPDAAFTALVDGKTILDLTEGLQFRRARGMGSNRVEFPGFTHTIRDRPPAHGPFTALIPRHTPLLLPSHAPL